MANRVAPACRFYLDNSTLTQAIPIRYLFFYLLHIIVIPTIDTRQKFPNALKLQEIYARIRCRVERIHLVSRNGVPQTVKNPRGTSTRSDTPMRHVLWNVECSSESCRNRQTASA